MIKPFVTMEDFASIACMDGYAFGVATGSCDTCDYLLNPCLRRNLRETLLSNQYLTEDILGYDLQETYRYEDVDWVGDSKIVLSRKGIAAVNVKQTVTEVAGGPFDIDYMIAEELAPEVVSGRYIVTIPVAVLENPEFAIIRDHLSGSVQQKVNSYPYPQKSGTDWKIQIDQNPASVDVFHCKYATVTITTPVCVDGEIVAVYPGTEDYIPFAKDPVVSGANTTYTFYLWSLVDRSFSESDKIDLEANEYYKLLTQIDFACLKEAVALPVVVSGPNSDGVFTSEEQPITSLVATLIYDGIVFVYSKIGFNCGDGPPIKIRIFYRTDPELIVRSTIAMKEAITYLTAAELLTKVCDCEPPLHGFIFVAQQHYGKLRINPISGEESWQLAYGDKHGQLKFAQAIRKAKKVQETFVL